jgi:hypothetical protein
MSRVYQAKQLATGKRTLFCLILISSRRGLPE